MNPRRRLNVKREILAPLEPADLGRVAGNQGTLSVCRSMCTDCINDISFEWCPMPGTLPLEECI